MRVIFVVLLVGCGTGEAADGGLACADRCSAVGATRCSAAVLSSCDGQCWNTSGTCTIVVDPRDAGAADAGHTDAASVCSSPMGGEPERACTADLENVSLCPSGPGGVGLMCSNHCWRPFADGPCSGPGPNDGGVQCPADPCVADQDTRCQNGVLSTCHNTCWSPTKLCD